jgi:hypothetical protein
VQLLRALPRPATRALYGLYGVHELLEDHRVVYVGPARHHRQRDAPSVRNKVALRARFSLIRWILAGFLAPLFAGMEAESKEARSQSIRSASPRRSKRTLCSLSHTPASCHSRKRRQHVTPEPQPISLGSISQGMPLFKTKMMPASAERLSTRGLPPFGLGASSGNNGSIVFHSSSDTSSLAMSLPYPHQRVLKGSLRSCAKNSFGIHRPFGNQAAMSERARDAKLHGEPAPRGKDSSEWYCAGLGPKV